MPIPDFPTKVFIQNKFDWILPNYVVEVSPYFSHPFVSIRRNAPFTLLGLVVALRQ